MFVMNPKYIENKFKQIQRGFNIHFYKRSKNLNSKLVNIDITNVSI